MSLTDLGKVLNRDIVPLGRTGRRLLDVAKKDEKISNKIKELQQIIAQIAESKT